YLIVIRRSIHTDSLIQYHQPWFFSIFPSSKEQLLKDLNLFKTFPYYTAGYTVIALAAGGIGIVTGLIYSSRKDITKFLLLGVPFFIAVIASGFEVYSLMPRMMLWAIALLLLLQGIGWQWIAEKISPYLAAMLLVVVIISVAGLQTGWQVFYKPLKIEEIRTVLDSVRNRFMDNDELYVHHEAWPALAYYKDCDLQRERYQFGKQIIRGTWNSQPNQQTIITSNHEHGRVWLIYSHVISESTRQAIFSDLRVIEGFANPLDSIKAVGAFGYLYEY
ncbi:MAG: hypothetical protein ABIQ74_08635, partial [Chitinophagales bacterium]